MTNAKKFANWVDTSTLADEVKDTLEEAGVKPTLENMQKVWLNFLETELHNGVDNCVDALKDKGELK